jgi:HD-GYP domain-containing protein (c-di-GMP phosphodiesterase class II)
LGLTAERLSPMSRALAVADVYEATTSDRPYRRGLPRNEAVAILRSLAATALCPSAVEALASELD